MRKPGARLAFLVLGASLVAACGSDDGGSEGTDSAAQEKVRVGITQFATIPPLDGLREQFIATMDEEYGEDGWEYEYLPAEGDVGNTSAIATQLASGDYDIYLAIATASAQALVQEVTDKPVIFAAVADPVGAGILDSNGGEGGNSTGVSSLGPIKDQMQLIADSVQDVEKVGLLYNDAEQNAVFQADLAAEALADIDDIGVARQTASVSSAVAAAANQLASESQAMWFPASSTALEGLPALYQASVRTGVPVFCADTTAVAMDDQGRPRGCVGTVGFSYPGTGVTAAELAIRVLDGEEAGSIPTVFPPAEMTVLNACAAEEVKFEFPQAVLDEADEVLTCD